MKTVKVIEAQGFPHTLTQTDGKTFRIFARQTKVIDEKLVSADFLAEKRAGGILIVPVENEETETKTSKGGTK